EDLPPPAPLRPEAIPADAILFDVRDAAAFARGHVLGSVNVGLGGAFALWAGAVVPMGRPIVLVSDGRNEVKEAAMRLARIGFESVVGYLDGGVAGWSDVGRLVATMR